MAVRCRVCESPRRAEAERLLTVGRASLNDVARQTGLSRDSLHRHLHKHLLAATREAAAAGRLAQQQARAGEADGLLGEIRELQQKTLALLEEAAAERKYTPAVLAVNAARQNLELLAKLTGQLEGGAGPTLNIWLAPEFATFLGLLQSALVPYPAALTAVIEAVRRASGDQSWGSARPPLLLEGQILSMDEGTAAGEDRGLIDPCRP